MGNELTVQMKGGMVQLTSVAEALSFAQTVFQSGLAPTSFKTPQAIFLAVQMGAELGMSPVQSLQGLYAFNGRVAMMNKTARGLVAGSGKLEAIKDWFEGSGDDMVAICTAKRVGIETVYRAQFGVADARRAGLWGKAGVWTNYPKDMLYAKASARALSMGFADVLIGLPVFEDIQDLPPERKPSENPHPVEDPLLKQVPSLRQLMEEKANNPTRDGASITGEEPDEYDNMGLNSADFGLPDSGANGPASTPSLEQTSIHPDDADYQASLSKNAPENISSQNVPQQEKPIPAGANSVVGEMIVYAPAPKSKQPWSVVISGIKMAVWKRSLPLIVEQFEKGNFGKGVTMRADYTTVVNPPHTNHTCVHLEKAK